MPSNRSATAVSCRPANRSAISLRAGGSTLTQKTPLAATIRAMRLSAFRQTSAEGGSADTEQKALTVAPWRPAGPSVVTTVTLLATARIAAMKSARGTGA